MSASQSTLDSFVTPVEPDFGSLPTTRVNHGKIYMRLKKLEQKQQRANENAYRIPIKANTGVGDFIKELRTALLPNVTGISQEEKRLQKYSGLYGDDYMSIVEEKTELRIVISFKGPVYWRYTRPKGYVLHFAIIGGSYLDAQTWEYKHSIDEMSQTLLTRIKTEFEPYRDLSREEFKGGFRFELTKRNFLSALKNFPIFFMQLKHENPKPGRLGLSGDPVIKISYPESTENDPDLRDYSTDDTREISYDPTYPTVLGRIVEQRIADMADDLRLIQQNNPEGTDEDVREMINLQAEKFRRRYLGMNLQPTVDESIERAMNRDPPEDEELLERQREHQREQLREQMQERAYQDFLREEKERKRQEALEYIREAREGSLEPPLKRQRSAAARLLLQNDGDVEAAAQMMSKIEF